MMASVDSLPVCWLFSPGTAFSECWKCPKPIPATFVLKNISVFAV